MTQAELERELAHTTGESLATIRSRGFQLVEAPEVAPLTIDWDALQQVEPARRMQRPPRRQRVAA